jgi:hypothetical protein
MADKPILFSAPMVRAILDGRKTVTRRVLKTQPPAHHRLVGLYAPGLTAVFNPAGKSSEFDASADIKVRLSYAPGDRLWVREAMDLAADPVCYVADREPVETTEYEQDLWMDRYKRDHCPGIHMPRWASRLTLIVTAVKVERVQDISRGDAMLEGCPFPNMAAGPNPRDWFRDLWNSINGPGAWDANPWVAAISFRVIRANIDAKETSHD